MEDKWFLTKRWNIVISLVQGIPTFAFVIIAVITGFSDTRAGMITLSIAGSLFCLILEYHSSARFQAEWQRTVAGHPEAEKPRPTPLARLLLIIHSLAFWFFLIPLFTSMSYRTGFITFAAILFFRLMGNSYVNMRDFGIEEFYRFPFRIP